jgi:hypothetical protein
MDNKMAVDRLDTLEGQVGEIHKFMVLTADFIRVVGTKMGLYDEHVARGMATRDMLPSNKKTKVIKPNRKRNIKEK